MDILDLIDTTASVTAVALTGFGYYRIRTSAPSWWTTVTVWLLAVMAWLVVTCADLLSDDASGWVSVVLAGGCLAMSWKVAQRADRADGDVR